MNRQEAIYTEKNNCQDCYKCIRHCPVKAIKIENHSASIMHDQCIFCGECVSVCPAGAKKIRNDVQIAQFLLKQSKPVVLSLAPSYIVDFDTFSRDQLLHALKQLGFSMISETAIGAEILSEEISRWMSKQKSGVYLSSCCPVVVQMIQKYYPELVDNLIPFMSPAQVHAKFLKELYGDVNVIFAGPCIAKKTEIAFPDNEIDLVLSFQELNELLQSTGLHTEFMSEEKHEVFEPFEAVSGKLYPVDGGMLNAIKPRVDTTNASYMSFSGLKAIQSVLGNLPETKNNSLFIELMACPGGCVNGPGRIKTTSIAQSRVQVINNYPDENTPLRKIFLKANITLDFHFQKEVKSVQYSDEEIVNVLRDVGKTIDANELNCGGCGYYTCRQFAKAILEGKAEKQMCVSYMRQMAQNKASVLLHKMPYGVVIVNEDLKIIESNKLFARICGPEVSLAYDAKPGLEGANICKVTPMFRLFQNLLESGNDRLEKQIRFGETALHVSVFTIQKHKQVCAIVQNPDTEIANRDDIMESMKQVIRDNMLTAQKVAGLLGENASSTECLINKILDSYSGGDS